MRWISGTNFTVVVPPGYLVSVSVGIWYMLHPMPYVKLSLHYLRRKKVPWWWWSYAPFLSQPLLLSSKRRFQTGCLLYKEEHVELDVYQLQERRLFGVFLFAVVVLFLRQANTCSNRRISWLQQNAQEIYAKRRVRLFPVTSWKASSEQRGSHTVLVSRFCHVPNMIATETDMKESMK